MCSEGSMHTITKKFVYVDKTLETNPRIFYVGKGSKRRVDQLKRNKKHSAISKRFGIQRIVVFETHDENEANKKEIDLIKEYKTLAKGYHVSDEDFGCNFTKGGEGLSGISEVEKVRRSDRMKSRWSNQKEREKLVKIQNSENTKNKKSEAMKSWISTEAGKEHMLRSLELARNSVTHEARVEGQNRSETKKLKSDLMKKHCSDPEVKMKKSEDAKKNWSSQEYREKQKKSRDGWKPSEEMKEKIRKKLLGHFVSEETKEKMRKKRLEFIEKKKKEKLDQKEEIEKCRQAKLGSKNPAYGKPQSEEAKRKNAESNKIRALERAERKRREREEALNGIVNEPSQTD